MVLGDCDAGVRKLADALGWRQELEEAWRELVGEDEAERQLQGATKRVAEAQDEVGKLAEEVEEVLHIDDGEGKQREAPKEQDAEVDGHRDQSPPAVPRPAEEVKGEGEPPTPETDVPAQSRFGDGAGPPLTDGKGEVEQGEEANKDEVLKAGAVSQ
jgi:NAD-dependent histone deacetylase SIR2